MHAGNREQPIASLPLWKCLVVLMPNYVQLCMPFCTSLPFHREKCKKWRVTEFRSPHIETSKYLTFLAGLLIHLTVSSSPCREVNEISVSCLCSRHFCIYSSQPDSLSTKWSKMSPINRALLIASSFGGLRGTLEDVDTMSTVLQKLGFDISKSCGLMLPMTESWLLHRCKDSFHRLDRHAKQYAFRSWFISKRKERGRENSVSEDAWCGSWVRKKSGSEGAFRIYTWGGKGAFEGISWED